MGYKNNQKVIKNLQEKISTLQWAKSLRMNLKNLFNNWEKGIQQMRWEIKSGKIQSAKEKIIGQSQTGFSHRGKVMIII